MIHFLIFGTPNISGMNEARNFQFGSEMYDSEYQRKNAKLGQKGLGWGSRDPLFVILGPPNIFGIIKARIFKFGTEIDSSEY